MTISQNEINEVSFFDVVLPVEVALRIFSQLHWPDVLQCALVSVTFF